ncbi:MAG: hypothetical protein U0941_08885 [Planctomycetaceae bacterium]
MREIILWFLPRACRVHNAYPKRRFWVVFCEMRVHYWNGAAWGGFSFVVASCVWWNGIIWWDALSVSREESTHALTFDPPFLSGEQAWILPGDSQEFTVTLKNTESNEVWIDDLRFSCSCASGSINGKRQFPVRIPARDSVPVKVDITSRKGERGPLEVRFGVVGRIGNQRVDVGSVIAVRFVQHLNAEPASLVFSKTRCTDAKRVETIDLWFPKDDEVPQNELNVESDDPSISVLVRRFPTAQMFHDNKNQRMMFAQLDVTLDPKIAPERMRATVVVRSGVHELRIPVVAFIEQQGAVYGAK